MNILDTVRACRELRRKLNASEVTIEHAHAEARVLGVESRAIEAAIDAARLTGRLGQDQGHIPDTVLGDDHQQDTGNAESQSRITGGGG